MADFDKTDAILFDESVAHACDLLERGTDDQVAQLAPVQRAEALKAMAIRLNTLLATHQGQHDPYYPRSLGWVATRVADAFVHRADNASSASEGGPLL